MRRRAQKFVTRRSHHDSRLLDTYVGYVNYEDTNVQSAMLTANGLMSIGSGNEFILNHGGWVKKAESWTKFSVISSFAMVVAVSRCHSQKLVFAPEKALEAMQNFLSSEKEEEQAGGLFGYAICAMSSVGVVSEGNGQEANADADQVARMRRVVRENGDKEMLLHACALSLGLLFCGSYDQGLTDELFALIGVGVSLESHTQEKPFAGMAAGIAIGLVNCGRRRRGV